MDLQLITNLPSTSKLVIFGLGVENKQFLQWLLEVVTLSSDNILIADRKEPDAGYMNKLIGLGFQPDQLFWGEKYTGVLLDPSIEYVFKSPGIWSLLPELVQFRQRKGEDRVQSGMVFFFQKFREQIIAVNGTKGKSTTSSLLQHILQGLHLQHPEIIRDSHYCGNTVGVSPYQFWTDINQEVESNVFFVVETSSFQLQDLAFAQISPKRAIVTNYYIDHLDQHGSKEEYWLSKDTVFRFQKPGDKAFVNTQILDRTSFPELLENQFVVDDEVVDVLNKSIHVALPGRHNEFNLALALLAAESIIEPKLRLSDLVESLVSKSSDYTTILQGFQGLPYRLQEVGEIAVEFQAAGNRKKLILRFFNDGAASEPDAVVAALNSLTANPNEFVWVQFAGVDKGSDLTDLQKTLQTLSEQGKLFQADYCGQVGQRIAKWDGSRKAKRILFRETIEEAFLSMPLILEGFQSFLYESMKNYTEIFQTVTQSDLLVLNIVFSPSGSSFDEFSNYAERAEWWNGRVKKLLSEA